MYIKLALRSLLGSDFMLVTAKASYTSPSEKTYTTTAVVGSTLGAFVGCMMGGVLFAFAYQKVSKVCHALTSSFTRHMTCASRCSIQKVMMSMKSKLIILKPFSMFADAYVHCSDCLASVDNPLHRTASVSLSREINFGQESSMVFSASTFSCAYLTVSVCSNWSQRV